MAVLVGVDAAPSPGLRGPTNFAGMLSGADIQQLDTEIARHRQCLCFPYHNLCMSFWLAQTALTAV